MLQQEVPQDFVIATGEMNTIRRFAEKAFAVVGKQIKWQGKGLDEVAIDIAMGQVVVQVDPKYLRPTEIDYLLGDSTKAREVLEWASKTDFDNLVKEMVLADLNEL
jgi:GDPmannose 4,6-dehydratase